MKNHYVSHQYMYRRYIVFALVVRPSVRLSITNSVVFITLEPLEGCLNNKMLQMLTIMHIKTTWIACENQVCFSFKITIRE